MYYSKVKFRGLLITSVCCREESSALVIIRDSLLSDHVCCVVNDYDTFYGVGFDRWLKDHLSDLDCTFEVLCTNHFDGYPWEYLVKLDKNGKGIQFRNNKRRSNKTK